MLKDEFFKRFIEIVNDEDDLQEVRSKGFYCGFMTARNAIDSAFNTGEFSLADAENAIEYIIARIDARALELDLEDFKAGVECFWRIAKQVFDQKTCFD